MRYVLPWCCVLVEFLQNMQVKPRLKASDTYLVYKQKHTFVDSEFEKKLQSNFLLGKMRYFVIHFHLVLLARSSTFCIMFALPIGAYYLCDFKTWIQFTNT